MSQQKDGHPPQRGLFPFSALVLHHTVLLLLLMNCCEGQFQVIGPRRLIVAAAGGDIVLPCHIKPAMDAASTTVEWTRPDLKPRFVHVWRSGRELLENQHPSYKERTSLFINNLTFGDVSLKLSKVKLSDKGTYRCFIPMMHIDTTVELVIGSISSPHINISKVNNGVVLDCESRGWYPEPEVLWLDAEGNLLSAGPTETVRGPDDLYTVSSRVTVERHSNSFTCRVHQKSTNQTRDTHITVPEDFFMSPSSCTPVIAVSVVFGLMFVLAVVLLVWRWRQNKTKIKMHLRNQHEEIDKVKKAATLQSLIEAERRREQLETERQKTEEELKKKEEEQKDLTQNIETLREMEKELQWQKEKLIDQKEKAEERVKENEEKVQSVERYETEKERYTTTNKGQKHIKLKELIKENNWNLEERKKELQEMNLNIDKLLLKTREEINKCTEKKKNVEEHMEQKKERLEEIQSAVREEGGRRTTD